MSETFRDLSPGELQHTLIQFMGENMGALKQLDSSLVNKNATLRGMTLEPEAIIGSIPVPVRPQPQQQYVTHVQHQQPVALPPEPVREIENVQQVQQPVESVPEDPNQLTFEFINELKKDPSLKDKLLSMSAKIDRIESQLIHVDEKINRLIERTFKKKTQEVA
jgi:hypothetical protein